MGGLKTNLETQQGKATLRTCFACQHTAEKSSLLRLVVDEDGQIWPDLSAKLSGRGVYLCMEEVCLKALSDKKLHALRRDFSPQLPQWNVLQERMFVMLSLRIGQLMTVMKRRSAIGRDAVMHQMWDKKPLLIMFAADAGDAVLRQVTDAVEKRRQGEMKSLSHTKVLVSLLDANALGLALGREKVSVVAFLEGNPIEKFQQNCVWQQNLSKVYDQTNRENKVTNGE